MKRLKGYIYLMLFLSPMFCFADAFTGEIIDEQGKAIPFATIHNHRTEKHVHTNLSGKFELESVQVGDSLYVSSLGFEKKTVVVKKVTVELVIVLKAKFIELGEVQISSGLNAMSAISRIDLKVAPVQSSQEVLRTVPGLIIGQHAGGGKAEQIFLRGFDIDHGTDINITVDGVPVNMTSHAHGQGYADLHFVIPEMIEKVEFGKGPYNTNQGNFATAGYVAFKTKDELDNNFVKTEYGSFNTFRAVTAFNLIEKENSSAYFASEYQLSDGPFESSQNFRRINLLAKYTKRFDDGDKLSISVSKFRSEWDASGQIPQRLVTAGVLSRFGAVDNTEGGETGRTNLKLDYLKKIDNSLHIKNQAYISNYDFELFSNFTFFLEDSLNGDQIKQKEERQIIGGSSELTKFLPHEHIFKVGVGFRNDRVENVELSKTKNRITTLENVQLGDVDESNLFAYVNLEYKIGRLVINPGIRFDFFNFNYYDRLDTNYKTISKDKVIPSPKLNFLFNYSEDLQLFLKTGIGFHSNDTRVVIKGEKEILPAAYGGDLGFIWKACPKLILNGALWSLLSEQEFVYVGDAGIVEPSGKSFRNGFDFGVRYQIYKSLFFYGDVNYSHARSIDEKSGEDYIPLAPELTASGGLNIVNFKRFSGGIQYRYIADRPANEDNSIVAKGYLIADFNLNYTLKNVTFGFAISNLFDREWKETQFATESRLRNEIESVEEIHFTAGAPFAIRGNVTYKF
ncbi:MAG: TonB-dependent receptor plug domain-containing protein [Flavobacteriales bacterium]|nr:TonB-dependent receptor plug domain-containing protein [Flavobacteriales bacterium]